MNPNPVYSDYLFKVLLIGNSGVGKSSLLVRFAVSSRFINSFGTISKNQKNYSNRKTNYDVLFRMMSSQTILCQLLVLTLRSATMRLMEKPLNSKFGTQPVKKDSKLSHQVTIKEPTVLLLHTI